MEEEVRLQMVSPILMLAKKKGKLVILAIMVLLLSSLYIISHQLHSIIYKSDLGNELIAENLIRETDDKEKIYNSYLVKSTGCQIPNIDPHAKDAMAIFKKKNYQSCVTIRFTNITKDVHGNGVLNINETLLNEYLDKGENVSCCYSNVTSHNDPKYFDVHILKSDCKYFNSSVKLKDTEEFITTKCEVKTNSAKHIYKDAHVNIQIKEDVKKRFENLNSQLTVKPWNILILGIDTLSRINLARAMPKTNEFLKNNDWLDFQGYNKIDENTYPNIIALLTGKNQTSARKVCDRTGKNSPDNCDFMWKRYQNAGYVNAYGEDFIGIDTFGKPLHRGFSRAPTDHYLRPFFMSSEEHVQNPHLDKLYCTGQTTSGETLFDYALNFAKVYENDPYFGFFWSNTFSHDDLSSPSSMDDKVAEYLKKLQASDAMNTTFVWFISDHGIRFGKSRLLLSGYYEERLPSLFVWVPRPFINSHLSAYNNMLTNTKRLTTPYDAYMTLEDILRLSGKKTDIIPSEGCPMCRSLFQPIPWNRSCEESSISPHWCTCDPLKELPLDHDIANRAVKYVIDVEIENTLSAVNNDICRICAKLELDEVIHLYSYEYLKPNYSYVDYLAVFSTKPGNMAFESTVRYYFSSKKFEVHGIVSRLTFYRGTGDCVKTDYLKSYCYCNTICRPDFTIKSLSYITILLFICFTCVFYLLNPNKEEKKS